jgi:hypothetical protein
MAGNGGMASLVSSLSGEAVLTGATAEGGAAGYILPAWLAGKPLNEIFEIPGTAGAGGAQVDAYSNIAIQRSTSTVFAGLCGGHSDSSDNRVVSLDLRADSPTWVLRKAASTVPVENVNYYPDGTPSSRHVYQHVHVIEQLNRLMFFGMRFGYGGGTPVSGQVDGFNLTTNEWDPAGTWASVPAAGSNFGFIQKPSTGEVFTSFGLRKFSPVGSGCVDQSDHHQNQRKCSLPRGLQHFDQYGIHLADG